MLAGYKTQVQDPFAKGRQIRIFLSYGHDRNEELVRFIKADLEKRGHDVWFDKNEIKFGDEWRRAITDGILQSNRVLSFLSKHSTRDPGVCLDEIAIAIGAKGGNIQTILVESESEVKPPPSISHIQWLDMHDWKERRAEGETAWEQWYQAKLAEIVAVVESDESRRFAGEIETLEELLKPTVSDFAADARIRQLLEKKLVGRTWLFEAVEKWRSTAERDARLFWLMGAPGIGKSAFAAHLAHEYGRGTVIAVQFCDWKKPDHRDACRIIRTLAFQIATRLPDYRKLLLTLPILTELDRKNSAELFDGLLSNTLKLSITGGRERYLIVIDALDEAGGDGRNELVDVLARYAGQLPDWIGLVVTSRPEFDVTTPFQALKPFPLETKSAANSDDIRSYLRRELAVQLQNRPDADRLVEQILEKSEGVFLYVESFCEDIRKNHLSLDRPNEFPQGLGGIFCQYFRRQFPDLEKFRKDVRPALRAILAAFEPLPVEILQRLFNWNEEELLDFTRSVASIFPVTTEAGHKVIKPYHKSLADWLADGSRAGEYFTNKAKGHELLAEECWKEFKSDKAQLSDYSMRWGMNHQRRAGRFTDAGTIWRDNRLHKKRIEMGLSHSLTIRERFFSLSSFLMRWSARDTPRFQEFVEAKDAYEAFVQELHVRFDEMTEDDYRRAREDQRLRIAEPAFAAAAELSEKEGASDDAAVAKYQHGLVRHVRGELDEAASLMRAAMELMKSKPHGDPYGVMSACHYHLGVIALKTGRLSEAVRELLQSRRMDEAKADFGGVKLCNLALDTCAKAGADLTGISIA
jgi:hypothetical protein